MRFKDISLKFQALGLRKLLKGNDHDDDNDAVDVRKEKNVKKPSWMVPISHGYHVVEGRRWNGEGSGELKQPDTIVVQREEMGNLELWFYSVADPRIGDGISRHLQSHFFGRKPKESLVSRKSRETMRKAYLNARAKLESGKPEKKVNVGSVSVMVINGEKIVMAQMGGYRAIVCRDGIAHQLRTSHHYAGNRHWPHRLITGAMRIPKVHVRACYQGSGSSRKQTDSSELIDANDKIDSETEFIILGSAGIFEVMRNQEAVDLIRHIDDPQHAAECLAREALTRVSRSSISCLVIRVD